jgi:hypothetical protein
MRLTVGRTAQRGNIQYGVVGADQVIAIEADEQGGEHREAVRPGALCRRRRHPDRVGQELIAAFDLGREVAVAVARDLGQQCSPICENDSQTFSSR